MLAVLLGLNLEGRGAKGAAKQVNATDPILGLKNRLGCLLNVTNTMPSADAMLATFDSCKAQIYPL